jgi:hypothetical protein
METTTINFTTHQFYTWETIVNIDGTQITVADLYAQNFDANGKHIVRHEEGEAVAYINAAAESFFKFSVKMHKNILISATSRRSYNFTRNDAKAWITKVNDQIIYTDSLADMKKEINAALKGGK